MGSLGSRRDRVILSDSCGRTPVAGGVSCSWHQPSMWWWRSPYGRQQLYWINKALNRVWKQSSFEEHSEVCGILTYYISTTIQTHQLNKEHTVFIPDWLRKGTQEILNFRGQEENETLWYQYIGHYAHIFLHWSFKCGYEEMCNRIFHSLIINLLP